MSLGIFLALCIIGADLLIYFLFQWMYGEKRSAIGKKIAAQRQAMEQEPQSGMFVVPSSKGGALTEARMKKIRERMGRGAGAVRRSA